MGGLGQSNILKLPLYLPLATAVERHLGIISIAG